MTIKEKFIEILLNKGITEYKFYKESGVSRGTLSNKSGINEETITKFFAYFPDIDANCIFKQNNSPILKSYENAEKINFAHEESDNEIKTIDLLIDSKNNTIAILEREVSDLKSDKEFLKNVINQKLGKGKAAG